MDIVFFLKVLLRKKWYLILIPILTAVATYFFTAGIKPIYISTAKLSTGFTTDEQIKVNDDQRFNLRDADVKFNNLIQNINSESVLALLSYRLILNDLESQTPFRESSENNKSEVMLTPEELSKAKSLFKTKLDSMELLSTFDPFEAKLIMVLAQYGYLGWQLKSNLEVKRVKDTDFITVQFSSENPLLSAFAVNTLSEEYIRYDNSLNVSRSDRSITFFERLAKEKKSVLDEKVAMLNEFKVSNNVLNYQTESSTKMTQMTEYELRREQILSDIQRIEISLSSINRKLKGFSGGGDNPETERASINANIVRIREKIEELDQEYRKSGSANQELKKTIDELRFQLQVEMNKLTTSSGTSTVYASQADLADQREKYELELQIAKANLSNVDGLIRSLRGSVSGYASKEAAISSLQSEVDKANEEYLQVLDRFNTERSKSLLSMSPVKILVKGQPNGYPEFSKRYLIIVFAGVASFGLCVFAIIFIEYVDIRVKNPQQFRKFVKIPLIGSVNAIDTKNLNLAALFSNTNKDQRFEVFKHFLRKLRFEIESSKSKVILVTSTKPGEGKTFIILCLSYLLSMIQKKILIIDTNFKHNSLTQILLRKHEGVRKLEQGMFIKAQIGQGVHQELDEDDFANSIIYQTAHKGISIIGNSSGNESPSEIFAGRDFGSMLDKLQENFDYIILEGAALNNYSDTKELLAYSDKVLAVFSAESVIKQLDRESIDYLKNLNSKLLGAVLNKIETKELSI